MNISLLSKIGCSIKDVNNVDTIVKIDEQPETNVIFDNCHMIKNVRNAFADLGELIDIDGGLIKWSYLRFLYELQSKETFHISNRITRDHIYYENQKMKVRLAVQIFSERTADAIDYCRNVLKLPQFAESEPTTKFLRLFGEVFDLLNSHSRFGRWSKAPLMKTNTGYWKNVFSKATSYIMELRNKQGQKLVTGRRKVGFIGFIVNMKSAENLFERLVVSSNTLNYILTF